jgi:zinc D-Ala-D-Ala carboxypeptidase|tara:strand:- start:1417 stop:1821 length:405 start_codon:yes stop_codon:yes gene_type:complete
VELEYEHWKQVPRTFKAWKWKYFSPKEMACRGTGQLKISSGLLDSLDLLRIRFDSPITILSAYRSVYHNSCVGGAVRSRHLFGDACDISIRNKDKFLLEKLALELKFTGFGYYNTFLHLDKRPKRARWGKIWHV